MKKKLLPLTLFFIICSFTYTDTLVYLCRGKNSKRYHFDRKCKGLAKCTSKIDTVTIKFAQNIGRTLCGYED